MSGFSSQEILGHLTAQGWKVNMGAIGRISVMTAPLDGVYALQFTTIPIFYSGGINI